MTDGSNERGRDAPDLRLRGEPPRVTRLSRRILIGLGGLSALAIAGALGYALQTRNKTGTGQELLSTENRPAADGLAGLPEGLYRLPSPNADARTAFAR